MLVDPPSLRVGLPDDGRARVLRGRADAGTRTLAARSRVERSFGRTVEVPFGPFLAAGELLYQGPWVAERLAEFGDFLAEHPDSVLPVIRDILEERRVHRPSTSSRPSTGSASCAPRWRSCGRTWTSWSCPRSAPPSPSDEVLADPIGTNTALGHYTHFGNLLDLCAAVVPAGLTSDGRPAVPDGARPGPGRRPGARPGGGAGRRERSSPAHIPLARADGPSRGPPSSSSGHHLAGQPRNVDSADRGGYLLDRTTTSRRATGCCVVGDETPGARPGPGPHRRGRDRGRDLVRPVRLRCPTSSRARRRPSASARSPWPTAASELGFVADASVAVRPPTPTDITESSAAGAATWPPVAAGH